MRSRGRSASASASCGVSRSSIENRTGAGGNIGAQAVARSAPDGYTLMFSTNGPLTTNAGLYRSLGFDPEKDFEPRRAGVQVADAAGDEPRDARQQRRRA